MKENKIDKVAALKEFWDKRFGATDYVYGKEPNAFFKSVINDLKPGTMFVPGAGEGRDAVYAATKGWQVLCADISIAGKHKAMQLAAEKNVEIQYEICDINDVSFPDASFDMVTSIFFHLPEEERLLFFRNSMRWLKPGGIFLLEAFTPLQLQYSSGGPKEIEFLVSAGSLKKDLIGLETLHISELEIDLDEGKFHRGHASVVEYTGKKI